MLNSTPFTLTATDSLGCIGTDQVNVIVYGQPLGCIAVADPIIVCQGTSCNLNAIASGGTGSYTYAWSSNPPGFTSNIQNPVATPTATTQYIVTVTNGTATESNSITVTISPKPSAAGTITGPGTVCAGQNGVTYSVPSINNANGYIWSLPFGATIGSGSNTNTIVVNFSDSALAGNITVIGTNNCGSGTVSPNKSVIVNPKPVANAGTQQNITNGLQTTLQGSATGGSGNYSYLWSPANMLNTSPNIQTPQTVPLVNSITYSLTVTDNQTGCSGTSSVLVLVIGFPLSASTSAVPGTICQSETSQITAIPNGGSGNYTFAWSSNPSGFTSTDQSPIVSPSVTTEYIVTITAGVQTATANVIVTVSPIPAQPGLITGNDTVCKGDTYVTYTVPAVTGANVYHWQLPSGTSIYSGYGTNTIIVNYGLNAVSGNISVYASNFCGTGTVSAPFSVHVNTLPVANAGNDVVITIGGVVTLQGTASGGSGNYSYSWSPALLFNTSSTIPNPTTIGLANSQIFTLSVTDEETGCINTSQVQAIVSGGPLTATATAANTTICEGTSTQLNALPQGGTGVYTYYWTSNPPGFTSTLKNPTVTPDTLVTEYTVLVDDGFDQAFSTIVITLNPLPVAPGIISGDTIVCQGETGILYSVATVPNSSGYIWTLPTGCILASGSNTSTISANYSLQSASGVITVAATNFCGTGPTSPPLSVQINTLPQVDAGQNIFINQNSTTQLVGNVSGGSGNYTYEWTPSVYLVNPNITNPATYPMSSSVLFTFKVTDNSTGCNNTDMVQVIVTGLPLSVNATADPQSICQGDQSTLFALPTGGTGSYTYLWTSNPPGLNSVLQNPIVSPTVTTQYNVEINDGTTTANSLVTVTVNDLPSPAGQISGPTAICKGASNVSFSVPLIPGATSYVWQLPGGGTISSGANTNSITANFTLTASTGLISVYGVNACGNGTASSYQLTLNPLPTASAGSDMFINNGSDTILYGSATGGFGVYSYLWAPSILLINDTLQQCTTVALNNPTTFYLTVTDLATGCKGKDDVTVYIMGGVLTAAATASPTNICQGQTSQLNAVPTGGGGNYTYSWSSIPSGYSSIIQNPIVTPSVSTTYTVTITSGVNTATASVVVTVNPLPSTPGAITGTNTVCQGASSIIYTVAPVNGASSYNWTLPPGATIIGGQGTNSIAVYFASNAVSGNIIVNGINLCGSGPSSSNYLVTVNPSPVVNAGSDQYVYGVGNSANLNGTVSGGIGPFAYQWSPLMFFSPQSNANQLNTTTMSLYSSATLTLTVLDSATGCSSSDQMNIYIGGGMLTLSANTTQQNICEGQSTQLNALPSGGTGNYTYYWTSFPPGPTYTIQNPTVSPTVTTQYLATVYDGVDSASYSLVINVSPQPTAAGNIIGSSLVCQGDEAVMFTVPSIANATSYIWNLPPTGFTIASGNGTNTIYVDIDNNANSGSIYVYGTNACGIGAQSPYFNVNVNLTPFAYTSADQYIPQNSSTQMFGHAVGGSGSYTYTWEPSNLVQQNNVQNPYTVNLSQSNVYTLTVYDNFTGCQSSDIIQIIVYGGPLSVAVSSNIYSICGGQSVQLNALPTGGNGQYIFNWTPNTYINNATIYNPVATPNVTTEYTVEVVSGGLTATNSLLITVYPQAGNAGNISGSSSVCQGETGVLFSVPPIANATNYYWTVPYGATIVSGGNTNNIMVNFSVNATSGNISVYGGNVCGFGGASQNFWLNVNPIPNVSAGPDQQITSGLNTNLYGLASGGSGGYSYLWTPESLLLDSSVLNPITIALTSSHIFTLYVTDTVSGCVNSDYMKVIVCGGPLSVSAFVNNNNICYGQTVQLDALPSGGNCVNGTYNWSSIPSGFSSSLVNPVASPTITTTYIVDYNDGDNIATSSVVVTVNPLVDDAGQIQGPSSVCQNSGTVIYSVPPITGATSYVWTFPQGTTIMSNPDSNVVEVLFTDTAESGFVSVYATSFCGIGGPSLPYPVVVKPLPGPAGQITGPTYMAKNNIAQFTVPPIPGTYYYYWVLPYGAVILSGEGTTSITVEFTDDSKSGFIYVYGMNSCGTGDPSYDHLLTIITSIAELYDITLKLYPNPNKGEFTLEIQATEEEKYQMKVLNLFGSVVYSTEINKAKNHLDLSHLPNGMYYLELRNENVKILERFVIVK